MPVVGLDLSLTATGICVLERGDEGRGFLGMVVPFRIVHTETVGYGLKRTDTERDRIDRLIYNATRVVDVIKRYGATAVGIENYAYAQKGANISSAELGGVVKSQLMLACKITPRMVVASEARLDLFGHLKKKDGKIKEQVKKHLLADGLEFKTGHEMDAFVIALFILRQECFAGGRK